MKPFVNMLAILEKEISRLGQGFKGGSLDIDSEFSIILWPGSSLEWAWLKSEGRVGT